MSVILFFEMSSREIDDYDRNDEKVWKILHPSSFWERDKRSKD